MLEEIDRLKLDSNVALKLQYDHLRPKAGSRGGPEKTNAGPRGSQTGAKDPEAEPAHPRSTDPSGTVRVPPDT